MTYDPYRNNGRTRPLPGGDGMAGLDDMGAVNPAPTPQTTLVKLPNGVFVSPTQIARTTRAPIAAVTAAIAAVYRARNASEASDLVDQIERSYGLSSSALDSIAASVTPILTGSAPSPGLAGLGSWGLPDFVTDAVGTVANVTTAVATGGASLLLPSAAQPSGLISNPSGAVGAVFQGGSWVAHALGKIGAGTLITAGKALTGATTPPPAAPAPAPPAKSWLSYWPWAAAAVGGLGAAYVISRVGRRHT